MKIQSRTAPTAAVFQMEPARATRRPRCSHTPGRRVFYFDNPNVGDRLGEGFRAPAFCPMAGWSCCDGPNPDGTVTVTARVQLCQRLLRQVRRSRQRPQAATQIVNDCVTTIPNPFHPVGESLRGVCPLVELASGRGAWVR